MRGGIDVVGFVRAILLVTILLSIAVVNAYAERIVTKEVCLTPFGMSWKATEEAKEHLLTLAKREAVSELFGEMIRSFTKVTNFQVEMDRITALSAGFLRIKGNPEFFNGRGFGELCVRINAYVTDEDIARFNPRTVRKTICISDPRLPLGEVRITAERQARIQAVREFEPKLEGMSEDKVLSFLHESKIESAGFNADGIAYCTTVSGVVYPIEVMAIPEKRGERIDTGGGDSKSTGEAKKKGEEKEVLPSPPSSSNAYRDPATVMEFVLVKGGCFQMGDIFGRGDSNAMPIHEVCVNDFYLGRHEVTVGQFRKFVEETDYLTEAEKEGRRERWSNPGFSQGDTHPVVWVSYNDVGAFIPWLNRKTDKLFRLPTEAEWEYAARSGGKRQEWAGTSDESQLEGYAWYNQNSGGTTHPVGQKKPNGLGLHGMSGDVWEWVSDWYDSSYYGKSPKENPQGPNSGQSRVVRGGSWFYDPWYLRCSYRDGDVPSYRDDGLGFRLVYSPQQ
jgi:formylglycine-generating enzyme required for sulfatase activity